MSTKKPKSIFTKLKNQIIHDAFHEQPATTSSMDYGKKAVKGDKKTQKTIEPVEPFRDFKGDYETGSDIAFKMLNALLDKVCEEEKNKEKEEGKKPTSLDEIIIPNQKLVLKKLVDMTDKNSENYHKKARQIDMKNCPVNAEFLWDFAYSRLGELSLPSLDIWRTKEPITFDLILFPFADRSVLGFAFLDEKQSGRLNFYLDFLLKNEHEFKNFLQTNKQNLEAEIREIERTNPLQIHSAKFELQKTLSLNKSNFATIFQSFGNYFFLVFNDMQSWIDWVAYPAAKEDLAQKFSSYLQDEMQDTLDKINNKSRFSGIKSFEIKENKNTPRGTF